jgi:hypothetical protein
MLEPEWPDLPSLCTGDEVCEVQGTQCPPPEILPEDHPGSESFDRSMMRSLPFDLTGAWERERDAINHAWALLLVNIDLVEWSMCVLLGEVPESSRCLLREIRGERRVEVEVGDDFYAWAGLEHWCRENRQKYVAKGDARTVRIRICRLHEKFQRAVCTYNLATTLAAQHCAASYLAGLLLHELAHVCGRSMGLKHNELLWFERRPCDFATRVRAVWLWALAQRYRQIGVLHTSNLDAPCLDEYETRFCSNEAVEPDWPDECT